MFSIERIEKITHILETQKRVDVNQLSKQFKVTAKTIRQDLSQMEEMGILKRVHGGAVPSDPGSGIYPVEKRKQGNIRAKAAIAKKAVSLIDEGDIVILDGGSTTLELAKLLGLKPIIAITNDLLVAYELRAKEKITLYVTGGKLRREGAFTLLGREAEETLKSYNAGKLFLGTSALDFDTGMMVLSSDEAAFKKALINAAREIICLVDYSKFHKHAFVSFARLEEINRIITDDRITREDREKLSAMGIPLDIA